MAQKRLCLIDPGRENGLGKIFKTYKRGIPECAQLLSWLLVDISPSSSANQGAEPLVDPLLPTGRFSIFFKKSLGFQDYCVLFRGAILLRPCLPTDLELLRLPGGRRKEAVLPHEVIFFFSFISLCTFHIAALCNLIPGEGCYLVDTHTAPGKMRFCSILRPPRSIIFPAPIKHPGINSVLLPKVIYSLLFIFS